MQWLGWSKCGEALIETRASPSLPNQLFAWRQTSIILRAFGCCTLPPKSLNEDDHQKGRGFVDLFITWRNTRHLSGSWPVKLPLQDSPLTWKDEGLTQGVKQDSPPRQMPRCSYLKWYLNFFKPAYFRMRYLLNLRGQWAPTDAKLCCVRSGAGFSPETRTAVSEAAGRARVPHSGLNRGTSLSLLPISRSQPFWEARSFSQNTQSGGWNFYFLTLPVAGEGGGVVPPPLCDHLVVRAPTSGAGALGSVLFPACSGWIQNPMLGNRKEWGNHQTKKNMCMREQKQREGAICRS